jgi:hypothetical protein
MNQRLLAQPGVFRPQCPGWRRAGRLGIPGLMGPPNRRGWSARYHAELGRNATVDAIVLRSATSVAGRY